ncbi:MAG: tRNA pseudouridine(55) synthase TruB [Alphaproteobacteria bacterium]|nr:tRNA pseudouridine(55) synthase TruB [Alphaproteobacteria bacterium]
MTQNPPINLRHGWLVLDKPLGLSSAQAVGRVKRLLKVKKIGHAGTLDPLASGILPLAIGEATKTVSYAMDGTKGYRFTVRWGAETETDDAEGAVTRTSDKRPTREEMLAILPEFIGDITQMPPAYSALKVDGKRAYALARAGEEVVLAARTVTVHALALVAIADADHATFEVTCGKGTYVRALARDFGQKLSCLGHVSMLRRTQVGQFFEKDAISLDKLEELVHNPGLFRGLLPVDAVLDDILALDITAAEEQRLRNGQAIGIVGSLPQFSQGHRIVRVKREGRMVALGEVAGTVLKPVRVFNIE